MFSLAQISATIPATSRRSVGWCGIAAALLVGGRPLLAHAGGGRLELIVIDADTRQPLPCRIQLRNEAGKPTVVRSQPWWHDHFVCDGRVQLDLRRGGYSFDIERGPEYARVRGHFQIVDFADDRKEVELKRHVDMAAEGWWSGDLDVERPARLLPQLLAAEDLHLIHAVTWGANRPTSAPERTATGKVKPLSPSCFIESDAGRDARTGGPLLLFGLPPTTPLAQPPLLDAIELGQQDTAWLDAARPDAWDLPLWLAHDAIDSIQVLHSGLPRAENQSSAHSSPSHLRTRPVPSHLRGPSAAALWSQEIYFHVLNCGFRLPPTAGSGSGRSSHPAGAHRTYAYVGEELQPARWWEAIRAGQVTLSSGPLLRPLVAGKLPGYVFTAPAGGELSLDVALRLSTRATIPYVEIVQNGQVAQAVPLEALIRDGSLPTLTFRESGWFLLRAASEEAGTEQWGLTAPYYVELGDVRHRISRESVEFFRTWLDERRRAEAAALAQEPRLRELYEQAQAFWDARLAQANAD